MPSRNRLIPALCIASCALIGGAAASCSGHRKDDSTGERPARSAEVTLLITTDLQGSIEPCGCTTDPHGGIARSAKLVTDTRREAGHPVLYLDGGSLLYSKLHLPDALAAQETLKADLITQVLEKQLRPAAVGLGPFDLARGPEAVKPARQAANVPASSDVPLQPPRVIEAGELEVGVFGVVDPSALAPAGVQASDPAEAAGKAVKRLRKDGADVVVALAYMTRTKATELARAVPGIDFVVVGQTVRSSKLVIKHDPIPVGSAWLVEPSDRGQVVSRLDLTVRGGGKFADAIGKSRAEAEVAELDERIAALRDRLDEWKSAPDADPAFLSKKKKELAGLEAEKKSLSEHPVQAPKKGSYFTLSQIPVKRSLPCHEAVQAEKVAFDKAAGKANLARFADEKPAPAPEGKAGYVGEETCESCHEEEAEFWKTTKHHEAWETLEKYGKQYNLECVYCHVTGFDEPGGSNVSHLDGFRDVQCEECHGPGSLHAESGDVDLIRKHPPETVCRGCHNDEHSDTFNYEAYLRDVTGKGHGNHLRKQLGDGPTGSELRAAGLKKAGKKVGQNCLK